MNDVDNLLREGIAAVKAGQRAKARALLQRVLRQRPNDVNTWLWLSGAVETDDERRECLERVLEIVPGNPHAKRGLEKLGPRVTSMQRSPRPALVAADTPQLAKQPDKEVTYYSDDIIRITNARAIFRAKTYAMANITSVVMGIVPPNRFPAVLIAFVGLIISLLTGCIVLIMLTLPPGDTSIIGFFLAALIFGLLMIIAGIVIGRRMKDSYVVRIGSASGESDALTSKDREYIWRIVNAMNEAIVKRG